MHERPRFARVLRKWKVVIARNDHLRAVRQPAYPVERTPQLVQITALAHIASVNEDVPIGDDELIVKEVRVGDGDDPHCDQST
jgi:hypothetical protein